MSRIRIIATSVAGLLALFLFAACARRHAAKPEREERGGQAAEKGIVPEPTLLSEKFKLIQIGMGKRKVEELLGTPFEPILKASWIEAPGIYHRAQTPLARRLKKAGQDPCGGNDRVASEWLDERYLAFVIYVEDKVVWMDLFIDKPDG